MATRKRPAKTTDGDTPAPKPKAKPPEGTPVEVLSPVSTRRNGVDYKLDPGVHHVPQGFAEELVKIGLARWP